MNAIILAAGLSSRMFASGANKPKALLPIFEIPNIERTIQILHCYSIQEIIILVPHGNKMFDYLISKYNCKIINVAKDNKNTLDTIQCALSFINDTFIIEGDVVCTKNIFKKFSNSTYYTIKYPFPEIDDWHPVLNKNGNIVSFNIEMNKNLPAIFGISFWKNKDCNILKAHLKKIKKELSQNDENIFWDNYISYILDKISIKTYEISPFDACEMNNYNEYLYAQKTCNDIVQNIIYFFNNTYFCSNNNEMFKIIFSPNNRINIIWLKKLLNYYNEDLDIHKANYNDFFADNEYSFIIENEKNKSIAFFSLIKNSNHIFLRRLYIDDIYRRKHIGTQIIKYINIYCNSLFKPLRVNIYDNKICEFYSRLGFKTLYTTYQLENKL